MGIVSPEGEVSGTPAGTGAGSWRKQTLPEGRGGRPLELKPEVPEPCHQFTQPLGSGDSTVRTRPPATDFILKGGLGA